MTSILDRIDTDAGTIFETLNQADHFIWWVDAQSRFRMANRQTLAYSGFRKLERLVDAPYTEIPSEAGETPDLWTDQDQMTMASDQEVRLISYLKPYGENERILLYTTKSAIRDDAGRPVGTANHCFNITDCRAMSWVPFLSQQTVSGGPTNDSGAFTYQLCREFRSQDRQIALTRMQSVCLFLMLRGMTAKEIAAFLGRSQRTVEDHFVSVKDALNCTTRAQVLERAIGLGFMNLIPDGNLLAVMQHLRK